MATAARVVGRAPGSRRRRAIAVAAASLAVAAVLTGCSNDALAQQYRNDPGKNYISGSGVTELQPDGRGKPVDFSGTTEDGTSFSSVAQRGKVIVVNFWYAGCPPCRAEAADLQSIYSTYKSKGVEFIGVNTRDSASTARAYDSQFKITYPSILDADGGAVQLAFSGSMAPNATPTTFVIDQKGRIAARMEGPINDQPSTLTSLLDTTLKGH